jgi:trans-2,3-dihydro-3-hydroxyanthranilate isomerase
MKRLEVFVCDAFTSEPFRGNPAGVVVNAAGLSETQMQKIAREMNLSETAFLLPPSVRPADLRIRWYTPESEVPLCGHATVASFHALAEAGLEGMRQTGTYRFRLQTKSGLLQVTVEKKFSGTIIEFQLPVPRFRPLRAPSRSLLQALGLKPSDIHPQLPMVMANYLYVPVRSLRVLERSRPPMESLAQHCAKLRTIGVSLFTLETIDEGSAVHSRFYAPASGVPEDPVTGSANGPLGVYLMRFAIPRGFVIPSLLREDGRLEMIGEQGDEIDRRGRVKIRLTPGQRGPTSVAIAGEAVTIMRAELRIKSD